MHRDCIDTQIGMKSKQQTGDKHMNSFSLNLNIMFLLIICFLLLVCHGIHPNPGPEQVISIVHNNIRSLQNKAIYVEAELSMFDIIAISETWLYKDFPENKIQINGYQKPERCDRPDNTHWGGVAIYVKNNMYCKRRRDLEVDELEAVWVEVRVGQETLLVGCFYKPPDARVAYWNKIDESISKAGNTPYKYVILGDFNTNHNSPQLPHLNRIMYINKLHQVVNETTRYNGDTESIIDIILTPCPDIISEVGVLPPVNSDHCCPYIKIKKADTHNTNQTFKRTLLNYNKLDSTKFNDILLQTNWDEIVNNQNIDDAALTFSSTLLECAKKCMPVKTVRMRENDSPWMTDEIRKLIAKKTKIHSMAKRLNSTWSWELFRETRNKLTTLIFNRKKEYLKKIDDRINLHNNFGSKDWWKLVNRFSKNKGIVKSDIPPLKHNNSIFYSSKDIAELLNKEFITISTINGIDDEVPRINIVETYIRPLIITPEVVKNAITNLDPNKAAGPDLIHNKVLIQAVNIISLPLSKLFNRSLEESKFPEEWKKANVTAIFKKGDRHICTNYRPVSLLSCIGKLMERCVHNHVFGYLKENNLLTLHQSGFIPKDSTTYQLLSIYDDFCKSIDNQTVTQAIFFDISKAFDRVWHQGLIRKLHAIGIRNELLDWFKDYLKHRKQAVTIKGETSSYLEIQAGVPQGSVLGPTLFLIFINDIVSDIVSTIKLFADDTSIYLSLNDAHMRTVIFNDDMRKISNWAKKWKVDFNPDKSKLMTITNKQLLETQQLEFYGTQLNESTEHKHLGVILRNDCKWNSHINSIIEKTRIQIACLRSHKYKLGRRTLEIMYKSFILPHFDYADFLWDNCSETLSDELEKLNLDAIRTITGAVRGTSHHKLYEESGILPLKERRRRHKLMTCIIN